MSPSQRALAVALAGPGLVLLGLAWATARIALDPQEVDLHYLIFDPGHLVIAAGVIVSVISVPLAFELFQASAAEVEIPRFDENLAAAESEEHQGIPGAVDA
jgi:hypothetical protein